VAGEFGERPGDDASVYVDGVATLYDVCETGLSLTIALRDPPRIPPC
jgi:hypothetical protein